MREREKRIDAHGFVEQLDRAVLAGRTDLAQQRARLVVRRACRRVRCAAADQRAPRRRPRVRGWMRTELLVQRLHDVAGQRVLPGEKVGSIGGEDARPEMGAIARLHQLGDHLHPLSPLQHRRFERGRHAHFASDRAHILILPLE